MLLCVRGVVLERTKTRNESEEKNKESLESVSSTLHSDPVRAVLHRTWVSQF